MTDAADDIGRQIAALPMRWDRKGRLFVLMVTSRDTGRWVMPKGWHMDGKMPWHAAEIEALEEAGAKGYVGDEEIGTYRYRKRLTAREVIWCEVQVFPMIVEKLNRDWKERKERKRRWFTPKDAAKRVAEPELAELLRSLSTKPRKQPAIRQLLKSV
ncbi:NUDIX hydrolase [Sulfitobacter sp. LCG007]